MNLRQLIKYVLWRDTTLKGEYKAMKEFAGPECPRSIVDVGANDGFYGSNSFPFVARGWRALLIEPHPAAFAALRRRHSGRAHVTCLNLACGAAPGSLPLWVADDGDSTLATFAPDQHSHYRQGRSRQSVPVAVERLDAILTSQGFPRPLGILSIDTEGWDYEVLSGLDLAVWRPRLVVTEDGARAQEEKVQYLRRHGYEFVRQVDCNSFWLSPSK
jgi:FkbM family methyltransferase